MLATVSFDILACISRVIPTGTWGPTISRTARVNSASISGNSSDTAAPWLLSRTPSHGPWSRNIPSISPEMRSYASLVIVPIGPVRACINNTGSNVSSSAACKYPAIVYSDVAYWSEISSPRRILPTWPLLFSNSSYVAGVTEKVLVSCEMPKIANRILVSWFLAMLCILVLRKDTEVLVDCWIQTYLGRQKLHQGYSQ